jgi:hypothetical protein
MLTCLLLLRPPFCRQVPDDTLMAFYLSHVARLYNTSL